MEIFDITEVGTHGGSLRVFIQKKGGPRRRTPIVDRFLREEKEKGCLEAKAYQDFAARVMDFKEKLNGMIAALKEQGKTISGYGAPAKAKRVWVLDLAANAWKPGATSPPSQALNMSSSAYDANHNVVLLGGSYGQLMLYRWKGGCPKDAFGAPQK
jgi:hypothetical protein